MPYNFNCHIFLFLMIKLEENILKIDWNILFNNIKSEGKV